MDEPERVDVRELFRMVWRRRMMLIGTFLLGAILAGGSTHFVTPKYGAMSKVMLESRKSQVTSSKDVVSDLTLNDQVVNSEVSVLTSNVLIESVVRKIGLDRLDSMDPANQAPSLTAQLESKVKGLLGLNKPAPAPSAAEGAMTPEQRKIERLVWQISKNLKVGREGQSYVIDIYAANTQPQLAALLANTIAEQYISAQLDSRRATAESATRFLSSRVDELRKQVEQAEAKVEKFRAENLLVDGGTLDAANQQLAQLNSQLVTARADRIQAEARYDQIKSVIDKQGIDAVNNIVSSPALDKINADLMDRQRQDAIWAQRYGTGHPERQRLLVEIEGLRKDLKAEVQKIVDQRKNDVDIARIREATLQDSVKKMESRIVDLSRSTIGLRQLQREAAAARQAYEQLLGRLTDTRTQEQMQRADAKLIENATVPTAPVSPRPKLMTMLGGMTGLVLGLALVFFLEMTSVTFRSIRDVESETDLPVLAAIPREPWKSPLGAWRELAQNPYGLYAERIRHLRTSLLLRDGKEEARSVMLISSVPGEGKTTTTLSLARMAALSGKKVIVVDCDLRRATLYRTFGWQAEHDFAGFIANTCSLHDAIHRDPDLGFDVLAASTPRPDVADELAASWLEPMIETLKHNYDLVLVDAPALLAVSDGLIVGQAVDMSLYLVRWNSTPRSAVTKGISQCHENGLHLTGAVLSVVDQRQSTEVYTEGYGYSA
ncbi:GumC family protein [Acidimangrovimonas pyrenivorans]|uniref:non-specific protein-tyrosine kinase n=1 Tax=Acidimangrovimonas pyrenivorans TaxID=2030798 RepID=A0ABV7ABL7_9RHOB